MTTDEQARRAFMTVLRKNGRWKRDRKLEPMILKSPKWSARYAFYCVGRRWKQAEAVIAKDAESAFGYALNLRGPFPEAEKTIARDANLAYRYAKYILQERFPLGEKSIAKDPESAARYASTILKGRWKQAEKAIMGDTKAMLIYAKGAIKGQLPEAMHNAMVMQSFTEDPHAKKYGSTKKFMTPPAPKKPKKGKG
jgi:hypothetical protein